MSIPATDPRFVLLQRIASTACSQVWHARDQRLHVEVALKRPKELPAGENELTALRLIQHPHIVTLLDDGADEAGRFLCLQWLPGETLEARLARQPLDEPQTLALLRSLLSALVAVHTAGFAHADLKPENVMIDAEGHATLFDFGNATKLAAAPTGQVGSIFAMAPELFAHQPPSIATDLYALGVLAYQCLSGQLPFQGETKPQVIAAHHRHWRTPLAELCTVSPTLDAWIETLMAGDPAQRPPSAMDAWHRLEA